MCPFPCPECKKQVSCFHLSFLVFPLSCGGNQSSAFQEEEENSHPTVARLMAHVEPQASRWGIRFPQFCDLVATLRGKVLKKLVQTTWDVLRSWSDDSMDEVFDSFPRCALPCLELWWRFGKLYAPLDDESPHPAAVVESWIGGGHPYVLGISLALAGWHLFCNVACCFFSWC